MIVQWFQEGGWSMYALTGSACVVFAVGFVHMIAARLWSFALALVVGAFPCCCGSLGSWESYEKVENAVQYADPEQRAILEEVGNREASRPIVFGLILTVLAAAPVSIGEIRRLARQDA